MGNNALERLKTADVLKGLAVFFMIMVHIFEQFADKSANLSLIGQVVYFLGGPFCAPVFLAVMGYFLAASKSTSFSFLKRGLFLFAGGIILNILRSVHLFIAIFWEKYQLDPWFFVFGADILTLAGLSIIIMALIRLISKDNIILYVFLLLPFIGFSTYFTPENQNFKYLYGFIAGNYEHSYFPLFPWFSYVVAGYLFRIIYNRYKDLIKQFNSYLILIIIVLAVVVIISGKSTFETAGYLPLYYHHDYRFFAWTIAFMLVYLFLINQLVKLLPDSIIIQYIAWTGKNVTLIYVFQWIIIGNLATALYQTQDVLKSFMWFFSITLLSSLLTLAYLKILQFYKSKNDIIF